MRKNKDSAASEKEKKQQPSSKRNKDNSAKSEKVAEEYVPIVVVVDENNKWYSKVDNNAEYIPSRKSALERMKLESIETYQPENLRKKKSSRKTVEAYSPQIQETTTQEPPPPLTYVPNSKKTIIETYDPCDSQQSDNTHQTTVLDYVPCQKKSQKRKVEAYNPGGEEAALDLLGAYVPTTIGNKKDKTIESYYDPCSFTTAADVSIAMDEYVPSAIGSSSKKQVEEYQPDFCGESVELLEQDYVPSLLSHQRLKKSPKKKRRVKV